VASELAEANVIPAEPKDNLAEPKSFLAEDDGNRALMNSFRAEVNSALPKPQNPPFLHNFCAIRAKMTFHFGRHILFHKKSW